MIRLARVVAQSNHFVVLELVQAEKCIACPANCNKPLIDLFALRKNLLLLSEESHSYQLIDSDKLLSETKLLGQLIQLKFNTHDLMKSSGLMYFIPLLIILLFLSLGHFLGQYLQFSTDLSALFGFIVGFFVIHQLARKKKSKQLLKFRPEVTILSSSGT